MSNKSIQVEVVYALPEQQWLVRVDLPASSTAEEAIRHSGLNEKVPGGLPSAAKVGVWNHVVSPETTLNDGDRVEVYRPLVADPKEARRKRAKKTG